MRLLLVLLLVSLISACTQVGHNPTYIISEVKALQEDDPHQEPPL